MKKLLLLLSVLFIVSCSEDAQPVKYTLTTTVSPEDSGSINPNGLTVNDGQVVLLNAVPDAEYVFDKWSGDATGTDNPKKITMNSDKNITGFFKLKPYVYYPFNGDTKDYSGNDIHSESYNAELTEDRFGNKNFAYKFNGVNSVIKVNNPSKFILSNESFSISIWVTITDNEPTYRVFFIISNKDAFPRFELMKARSSISNGGIYAELLNNDNNVSGILVQLPLPAQINKEKVINAIDPKKDVDGFHPSNVGNLSLGYKAIVPCTPLGCLLLIKKIEPSLSGKHAVIIGRSNLNGKPMAQLLLKENCTVTITHSKTKDLKAECLEADIIVAAVGIPELVKADWVKKDAIVIDVGINKTENGIVGDVAFDEVSKVASALTPVPGGVGPMTIACLLKNTIECFKRTQ